MRRNRDLRHLALFPLFGGLMFLSDLLMEGLPNVHLVGVFLCLFTRVYRTRALIPLYVYVALTGLFYGFSAWWIPYLYVWLPLWGIIMLLPKRMSQKASYLILPTVCGLHGLLFGTLYAPVQALLFHFTFRQTLLWIAAGIGFDLLHAAGNFALAFLCPALEKLLLKLENEA